MQWPSAPFSSGRIATAAAREVASHGKILSPSSLIAMGSMLTEATFVGIFANKILGFFLLGEGSFWMERAGAISLDVPRGFQ